MSNLDIERYKTPEGVDNSLAGMTARLQALQPPLEGLMGKALNLFDDVFPHAPHPTNAKDSPVYAVSTMNMCFVEGVPMGRELTVVIEAGKWVRIFRNTDSCPDAYPRQRLWLTRPEGENSCRVNVMRTHDPRRIDYPYDIETADYNEDGRHLGFVGYAYYQQEPFIAEADAALDAARGVAQEYVG